MRADLGARLIAAGLVTREELSLALGVAPPHGGALARELVARGIEEDALAGFFLADGFGPLVEARELDLVDDDASRHFSGRMAVALLAVPVRRSPSGLVVAMADPSDTHVVSELRHVVGGEIVPAVARVRDLLATLARLFPRETLEPQPEEVVVPLARKKGEPMPTPMSAPTSSPTPAPRGKPKRARKETADFKPPAAADTQPSAGDEKPKRTTAEMERPRPRPARARRDTAAMERERKSARASSASPTTPEATSPREAGPTDAGRRAHARRERPKSLPPSPDNRWSDLASPTPTDAIARRAARARSVLPTRLGEERRAPIELDKHRGGDLGSVLASLRGSRTRDDALRLACEGVLPVCRAAVLLVLQKGILRGRQASGPGLSNKAIENLWIPTTSRSMFNRVVETGQPYVGPHGLSSADAVFRAAIGSLGAEIVLMPVLLSGRTIAVLAVDEPDDVDQAFERAEVVAQAVAEALRRIIVSGKSG